MSPVRKNPGPFTPADLPLDEEGRIYHLKVSPEEVAPDILIVGDPGRAEMIGETFFTDVEVEREHRGLVTVTGTSEITAERATVIGPVRATVTTSGMGTPSLEIVLNELVAVTEIDLKTRTRKSRWPRLHVIRVGTSGALQTTTKLGTPIITSYAIGTDNTGSFYEAPYPDETCQRLEDELAAAVDRAMGKESRFRGKIRPYVGRAAPEIVRALTDAAEMLNVKTKVGLTVSCSGFFAPQGRDVGRIRPSLPEADRLFAEFDPRLQGQKVENMEMEASFLLHFLNGLGHKAGAICTTIAQRRTDAFDANYAVSVRNATRTALLALAIARARESTGG